MTILKKIFFYFSSKIFFKLYQVIKITIISQIIIQINSGINTKISENFFKSELGQTLKSSII